ncbi:MAG: DUF1080 domain-containing protein [Armatimonadota bacterium]
MSNRTPRRVAAPLLALGVCLAVGLPALAAPPPVAISSAPPKGALVLFDGTEATFKNFWHKRGTKEAAGWTVGADGSITPNKTDIKSTVELGDFFLHVEFKCPTGHGNAGVGLQGRYEVQIYNSAGQKPEDTNAGAFYSQKPASVDASKPAGEWQSYDIVFRAPRLDAAGKVVEQARATVFQNGVLIHANNEFKGPTGIQYGDYKDVAKMGPIVLQGDHDAVQYRNIWVIPL